MKKCSFLQVRTWNSSGWPLPAVAGFFAIVIMAGPSRAQVPNPTTLLKFNENTGTVARDSAGPNNATLVGAAGWGPGIVGSALSLPGAPGAYADIPVDVLDTSKSFTVAPG
jgi:hypothetical protein